MENLCATCTHSYTYFTYAGWPVCEYNVRADAKIANDDGETIACEDYCKKEE